MNIPEIQKEKAKIFMSMHKGKQMFVIPNAWDVGSAYIFEKTGFSAIATSSAGIAYDLGYSDGETITFEDLLYVVKKIADRISVPLSVDFERGYSENISEIKDNARKLLEAGAVGFNIEDGLSNGKLSPLNEQILKIRALADLKSELDIDFVINARTCAYWLNIGDEQTKLQTAIERGNAFSDAGADCVFIPGAMSKETVAKLVLNIHAPLNIILNGMFHDFKELNTLGVRRLSVGSGPVRYICEKTIEIAQELYNGNVDNILKSGLTYAKANEYFKK